MACFVSLTFSIHLCSPQIPFKGKYAKESAFCGLPGLKTTKTAAFKRARLWCKRYANMNNIYIKVEDSREDSMKTVGRIVSVRKGIAGKMKNQSNMVVENKTKLASYYSLAPCISNKCICSFNGEHGHHRNTPTKHFEDIDSCSLNVSSCTQMTIIGYWVGPDIDDGWGFVEACIHQNS